jgi:hypothetical protein
MRLGRNVAFSVLCILLFTLAGPGRVWASGECDIDVVGGSQTGGFDAQSNCEDIDCWDRCADNVWVTGCEDHTFPDPFFPTGCPIGSQVQGQAYWESWGVCGCDCNEMACGG